LHVLQKQPGHLGPERGSGFRPLRVGSFQRKGAKPPLKQKEQNPQNGQNQSSGSSS